MQINSSSTTEVNIINFPGNSSPSRAEYVSAIHAFCESMAETVPPQEFGRMSMLARLDVQRKTIAIQLSRYYRIHKTADVAPGVFAIITLLTDNDAGVATISEAALGELFGRSENAIHEARKRLRADGMIQSTRGRYAGSHPIIPRAIAQSYNHLAWSIEAMRSFNPPATRGDCQSPCHTGELAQSPCHTGGLDGVNPPVDTSSIPLPHGGLFLSKNSTDREYVPYYGREDEKSSQNQLRAATIALAIGLTAATGLPTAAEPLSPPPSTTRSENLDAKQPTLFPDAGELALQGGWAQTAPSPTAKPKLPGSRLAEDWFLPKSWGQWSVHNCKRDAEWVRNQAEKFKEFWTTAPDKKAFKKNWERTWQNWCSNALKTEAKFNKGVPFGTKKTAAPQGNYSFSGNYIGRTI